ncbi:MAG: hypothetical protein HY343_12095 [Lentisphaerae bacterium]|nr:hypothetical protein [Lentisphaerota bacterium]
MTMMKSMSGKVLTARGPVEPSSLGRVLMHEHLHCDMYNWAMQTFIEKEAPASPERRAYLLKEAVPHLKACHAHDCHAYCDVTMPPWRCWPDLYREVAEAADFHIIVATGFYREVEVGTYWVKKPEHRMWPTAISAPLEALVEFCSKEILEGIRGSPLRAGVIKLGTSASEMTELEKKTFRIGARAQKATGVHITTHCTRLGAETSQLKILDQEGVDLRRVVIGHTAWHLSDPACRKVCLDWMKRGANFLPTNLGIPTKDPDGKQWEGLIAGIHRVFDAGHGDKLVFGLDSG